MKLYTEEQVLNMLRSFHNLEMNVQLCMLKLTPIELPSDEEVEAKMISIFAISNGENALTFHRGAKWVTEQIKEQAKSFAKGSE